MAVRKGPKNTDANLAAPHFFIMRWVRRQTRVRTLEVEANPLKANDWGVGRGATDSLPKPGDFPLGSPESRAAARAILQQKTTLSPYDEDCYRLYYCNLSGHDDPDYHWLENTEVYRRGREVRDALEGPIIPAHLDPEFQSRTLASILFGAIHGRKAQPGDILRYAEVADLFSPERVRAKVRRLQRAWERRLPEYPCPFRCEDGKMLTRQKDGSWQADWSQDAATLWSLVEDDAFQRPRRYFDGLVGDQPTIPAVVFIESKDGKRRAKPLETNGDLPKVENQGTSSAAMPDGDNGFPF